MNDPRRPSPSTVRSRSSARAYTAVEVLMAMTLAAIGSAAVVAMMKTAVQGDLDARKTDVANAIAHMWTERLRLNAMQWTLPNSSGTGNNLSNAKLINHVDGNWHQLSDYMGVTTPETMSYGFDILGRDLASADITADATFCVHVRETWLVAPALPAEPGLIRADVRVIWFRGVSSTATPAGNGICDTSYVVANPDPPPPILHAIYLTTTIKENGQQ
jgi:type II secretory pathway pseudopilin PulG